MRAGSSVVVGEAVNVAAGAEDPAPRASSLVHDGAGPLSTRDPAPAAVGWRRSLLL